MEKKPVWITRKAVGIDTLEDALNDVANEGYNVFKVDCFPGPEYRVYVIMAFDPAQLMRNIAGIQEQVLMGNLKDALSAATNDKKEG